jgi:tetrathionate reductase subunit B
MNRKSFIKILGKSAIIIATGNIFSTILRGSSESAVKVYNHVKRYALGIQIDKCIGCANCVKACKVENNVPKEPLFFRTWVERYIIKKNDEVVVECNEGGAGKFSTDLEERDMLRSFFVPKLCNHCENPPCAQVCPVGATFKTDEGIVLVDDDRCIGCSYCVQACPYGARYIDHHGKGIADKCTWCYHRLVRGLSPACVLACPVGARKIGNLKDPASEVSTILREKRVAILKPEIGNEPRAYYLGMDKEVR